MSATELPRLALTVLRALVPERDQDAFLGDLTESYAAQRQARGSMRAQLWLWRETADALRFVSLGSPNRGPASQPQPTGDPRVTSFFADIRHGVRLLRRAPGFTALALLTVGLGVGVTAAIFSIVNPVLLEPLPYPDPDRVVIVWERGSDGSRSNTGFATYADLSRDARTLERSAALSYWTPTLTPNDGEAEKLNGQSVSSTYFGVLAVRPALGRDFLPSDDKQGADPVTILSYGLWMRRFAGDSSIVGRPIFLNGSPVTVIGVMPRTFDNVLSSQAQLWRPLRYDATLRYACRTCRHLRMVARMRAGTSLETVSAELDRLSARLMQTYPKEYAASGVHVVRVKDEVTRAARPVLFAILGATALVLLLTMANVTYLQLARAMRREEEFAVRVALGAGRGRLGQQLLAEGLLLALLGGAVGVLVAKLALPVLVLRLPDALPRLSAIRLDPTVLGVAGGLTLLFAVAIGLTPAWTMGLRSFDVLRHGSRLTGTGRRATRSGLVVAEVALALVLLVGAGLLGRSLVRLLSVDMGFDPSHLLTLDVQSIGQRYRTDADVRAYHARLREAIRAIPGVEGVGITTQLPLGGNMDMYGVRAQDKPLPNPELAPNGDRYIVSPDYMQTMRIPLLKGRAFTEADDRDSVPAVVIVSAALAAKLWPGENALGKRVQMGGFDSPWREVVGIAGNVKHHGLDESVTQQFYVPDHQWPWSDNEMLLVARTRGDPAAIAPAVRRAIAALDPQVPISQVATMEQVVSDSTAQRRLALLLFMSFAGVALVIAAAGIYGVLSGSVAERTREIGVRAALGASPSDVLWMVLSQGGRLAFAGLLVGTGASIALSKFLEGLLFGVRRFDPLTLGGVVVLLAAIALLACIVPARHALKVEPVEALRGE
jgi:putative ABC transport system permease protein